MTAQYTLISRQVVSGSAATVTFSSIGSYQAYRIIASTLDAGGSDYLSMKLNTVAGDSIGWYSNATSGTVTANGFGYMSTGINAANSGPGTSTSSATNILDIGFGNSSSLAKPFTGFGGWAKNMMRASAGCYTGSSALTSIQLAVGASYGNLQVNTVIALYGRNIA